MSASLDSTRAQQPWQARLATTAVRALNMVGGTLRRSGLPLVGFDAHRLMDQACSSAGLSDFGDYPLLLPLQTLLDACDSEAGLNLMGRITTRWDVMRLLRNRLYLQRDWLNHPQIARQPVERPIIILGLPRSGTTLLHSLLAQDPALRHPEHWELMYPSPPPEGSGRDRDPRIRKTRRELDWFYRLAPEFRAIHMMGARYPQECTEITNHTFMSLRFDTVYNVPSYRDWLDHTGLHQAYAFHKHVLQHLQWRCPPRQWVLKAPDHVFAMDALLSTYPDARIVMTHRDPLKVVPSVASMTVALQRLFSDNVDHEAVARTVGGRWADGARRMAALRAQDRTPGRYLDVHYPDLVRDPMAVVRDLYDHFGMDLSARARESMEGFLADHTQGRHGRHRYSLEQFGLDAEDQNRQYRPYVEFFGVAPETTAAR
ncbi:MAG TPA: sulfotransferase [Gammaproteobacteria bacterium]|nr:sulfotransferase [Gammaproteobacteria bacterium]